jgi:hypothetical protein
MICPLGKKISLGEDGQRNPNSAAPEQTNVSRLNAIVAVKFSKNCARFRSSAVATRSIARSEDSALTQRILILSMPIGNESQPSGTKVPASAVVSALTIRLPRKNPVNSEVTEYTHMSGVIDDAVASSLIRLETMQAPTNQHSAFFSNIFLYIHHSHKMNHLGSDASTPKAIRSKEGRSEVANMGRRNGINPRRLC